MSTGPADSRTDTEGDGQNSPWSGPSRRGLKVRKREDHAVHLFRQALDRMEDADRLSQTLLELTRCYDPVGNGPALDPAVRRRALQLVAEDRSDDARQLLEGVLSTYASRGEPPVPPNAPAAELSP